MLYTCSRRRHFGFVSTFINDNNEFENLNSEQQAGLLALHRKRLKPFTLAEATEKKKGPLHRPEVFESGWYEDCPNDTR